MIVTLLSHTAKLSKVKNILSKKMKRHGLKGLVWHVVVVVERIAIAIISVCIVAFNVVDFELS